MVDINDIVNKFKEDSEPCDRYTSFDYCYNYFKTGKNFIDDIEKSCLVLGFYLASWGMYRGSSFILQKSVKHFEKTIIYIHELKKKQPELWEIDVDNYNEENIEGIIDIYNKLKKTMMIGKHSDLTLITKIILGVFGFVPAFDNYFCKSFREIFKDERCGFRRMNKKSLECIRDFYDDNKIIIDKLQSETFTTDFLTGKKTDIKYPKAKIIDMYGFTVGIRK